MNLEIDSYYEDNATRSEQERLWNDTIAPVANAVYRGDFLNEDLGADFNFSRSIRIGMQVFRIKVGGEVFEMYPGEDDEWQGDDEQWVDDDEEEDDEVVMTDSAEAIRTCEISLDIDRRVEDALVEVSGYVDPARQQWYEEESPVYLWENRSYRFAFTADGLDVKRGIEYLLADDVLEDIIWHSSHMGQEESDEPASPLNDHEAKSLEAHEDKEFGVITNIDIALIRYVLDHLFAT